MGDTPTPDLGMTASATAGPHADEKDRQLCRPGAPEPRPEVTSRDDAHTFTPMFSALERDSLRNHPGTEEMPRWLLGRINDRPPDTPQPATALSLARCTWDERLDAGRARALAGLLCLGPDH